MSCPGGDPSLPNRDKPRRKVREAALIRDQVVVARDNVAAALSSVSRGGDAPSPAPRAHAPAGGSPRGAKPARRAGAASHLRNAVREFPHARVPGAGVRIGARHSVGDEGGRVIGGDAAPGRIEVDTALSRWSSPRNSCRYAGRRARRLGMRSAPSRSHLAFTRHTPTCTSSPARRRAPYQSSLLPSPYAPYAARRPRASRAAVDLSRSASGSQAHRSPACPARVETSRPSSDQPRTPGTGSPWSRASGRFRRLGRCGVAHDLTQIVPPAMARSARAAPWA